MSDDGKIVPRRGHVWVDYTPEQREYLRNATVRFNPATVVPIRDGAIVFTKDAHAIFRYPPSRLTRLRRFLKL